MILTLIIKNYALIDSLNIDLDKGLSIITGETGAGKSIILGAMSLLLGQRADATVIQDKNQKCVVEAVFEVKNYNLKSLFEQNEIEYFENSIIRREIAPEGRSRAFVNDTPVNLSTLKEITEKLIDIHSQHDNLELNSTEFQIDTIDLFFFFFTLVNEYKSNFRDYKKLLQELSDLTEKANKEKQDFDYFQFQFDQIDNAKLNSDEQEELENEQKQLSHMEDIKNNLTKIYNFLNSEENAALYLLKEAANATKNMFGLLTKSQEFYDRIDSAIIDLQDLANETDIINNKLEIDPDRLNFVNSRLDTIYTLQHKFNVPTINDLLELKNQFAEKLQIIDSFDEKISKIKSQIEAKTLLLNDLAEKLHKKRTEEKQLFEKEIITLVQNLGMPNTQFIVKIEQTKEFNNYGKNNITFLFSANKNSDAQPITKVASGGELSRLMLAIKYIISKSKTLPTIIFDEIDTGVSGDIAAKMGNILQEMSKNIQIINITHLPQIAAKGHNHFLVYKISFDPQIHYLKELRNSLMQIVQLISKVCSKDEIR